MIFLSFGLILLTSCRNFNKHTTGVHASDATELEEDPNEVEPAGEVENIGEEENPNEVEPADEVGY